jgi:uncharacterized protein (TIGR00255 family)
MKSMTGHGRGEAVFRGRRVTAEVYSVNRKQLEAVFSLPRAFGGHGAAAASFEGPLRELITAQLSRGRVTMTVHLTEAEDGSAEATHLNEEAAAAYHRQLEALRRKLKIEAPVTLDQVLRGPGVVREADLSLSAELWLPPIVEAAKRALTAFHKMRAAEGKHLAADLTKRIREMEALIKKISKRVPQVVAQHREALLARLLSAGIDLSSDDERLFKEVTLFADRSDVSEELTRLGSHFAQFRAILEGDDAGGRTLEFLTQELNREINTIGSKANDVEIAHHVVALKSALEKVREQIQNFE